MGRKTKKIIGAAMVILICLFLIGGSDSSGLDPEIHNAIFMAYLNGYVDALELDLKTIKMVKEDRDLLRKIAEQATSEYISIVEQMNK
jgi:hypothetical protein